MNAQRATKRRKSTGPTQATKDLLAARAGGRCEICGTPITGHFSRHHRRARGSGGTSLPWVNDVSNLLLVCGSATSPGGCHQLVETQRQLAYAQGWAISLSTRVTAADIPVELYAFPTPMYLTTSGDYATTPGGTP